MKEEIFTLLKSSPLDYFFNPTARVFWLYLLSSALIAIVITFYSARRNYEKRFTNTDERNAYRKELKEKFLWSNQRKYWLNNAALLDYKYFFVIWFLKAYLISPLVFSGETIAIKIISWLNHFHAPLFLHWSKGMIAFLYTITLFVLSDFTRYWLHRWLHQSDILWQFHKVHHSAESLNPFTFYRTHPVENFLFGMRYALTAGLVTGIFLWLFGAYLSALTILGSNGFLVFFSFVGTNLRHSHIRFAYPHWLESYFISPLQHQLHHDVYCSRKNYGGYLAVWDNIFGSLLKTREIEIEREHLYGFAQEGRVACYNSIRQLLFLPFVNIYKLLKVKRKAKFYFTQKEYKNFIT